LEALAPHQAGLTRNALLFRDDERVRELPFATIAFADFRASAAALAAACSRGANAETSEAALRDFLRRADLLEEKDDTRLIAAAAGLLPNAPPDRLRAGLAGILREMAAIEPRLIQADDPLDVPLREAQRLAARWADRQPPPLPAPLP
jgi:hypothetical protein